MMDSNLRGYCPTCHRLLDLVPHEPKYPDDPLLEEVDFFRVSEHATESEAGFCPGSGRIPTNFDVDFGEDMDPPEEEVNVERDIVGDMDPLRDDESDEFAPVVWWGDPLD